MKKNIGCFGIFMAVMGGLVFVASIVGIIGKKIEESKNYSSESYDEYEYVEPDTSVADERISAALNSAEYDAAGEEDRHAMVAQSLEALYQEGELIAPPQYYEGSDMFTFEYANGMQGGISFAEDWESANSGSSEKTGPPLSVVTGEQVSAIIYNAFGDYAQEQYEELAQSWAENGVGTRIDNSVTVTDLRSADQYNVIVFSMHGKMYGDIPIIKTDDRATKSQDYEYMTELCLDNTIVKIFPADGSEPYYGVLPKFFMEYFGDDAFDGAVIFSEACQFFGTYPYEKNYYFADAFSTKSAEAVFGFYNSVYNVYSRDMLKKTLNDVIFQGNTPNKALQTAKKKYGKHDGVQVPEKDKYQAYLSVEGIGVDSVLFEKTTSTEAPTATEPPAATAPPQAAPAYGSAYAAYKSLLESGVWADYTASGAEGMSREEYARDCLGCYYLWDLDKNGTEELVISSGWAQANFCLTAFTYSDGNLYSLGSQYCGSGFAFGEPQQTGIVIKSYHGSASVHYRLDIVEGKLRITQQMEYDESDMNHVHHLTAGGDWRELEAHSLDDTGVLG